LTAYSTSHPIFVLLHYAKKKKVGCCYRHRFIPVLPVSALFNDFIGSKRKIQNPQNVVSAHPSNILHIENFSAIRFDQ